jgi:hypothetical protein
MELYVFAPAVQSRSDSLSQPVSGLARPPPVTLTELEEIDGPAHSATPLPRLTRGT